MIIVLGTYAVVALAIAAAVMRSESRRAIVFGHGLDTEDLGEAACAGLAWPVWVPFYVVGLLLWLFWVAAGRPFLLLVAWFVGVKMDKDGG